MKRGCDVQKCADASIAVEYHQWVVTGTCFSIAASVPVPGPYVTNRIGNYIRYKRVRFVARIAPSMSNPSPYTPIMARFGFGFDMQANAGDVTTYAKVFGEMQQSGAIASSYNSFPNVANCERFVGLWWQDFQLPAVGAGGGLELQADNMVYDFNSKFMTIQKEFEVDVEAKFASGNGNSFDYVSGKPFFIWGGNLAVVAGEPSPWLVDISVRFEFEDC